MHDKELLNIFNIIDPIPDHIIRNNPDPLFDLTNDVFLSLPSYMTWCLKSGHFHENIIESTILALSQLGRAKYSPEGQTQFKYRCNNEQLNAVLEFLHFYTSDNFLQEYAHRALKQWEKPIKRTKD